MVAGLAEVSLPCLPANANLDFVVAATWYGLGAAASQVYLPRPITVVLLEPRKRCTRSLTVLVLRTVVRGSCASLLLRASLLVAELSGAALLGAALLSVPQASADEP